jgi:hypothetical protein
MASTDDADHGESADRVPPSRGGSDFGPPVSEFGPPLDAFGPPTGDAGSVGWQPADAPDRPTIGWQPADGPERPNVGWQPADNAASPIVPAPPPQYRAPDSSGSRPVVRGPQYSTGSQETVRGQQYSTGTHETVRYSDQGGGAPEGDQGTWWQTEQSAQGAQSARQSPQAGQYGQAGVPRETPRSLWDDDDLARKLQAPREPAPPAKGKAAASGGSLWDDDDLAGSLGQAAPRSGASSAPAELRRNKKVLIAGVGAAVVVIAAIVAVVAFVLPGRGSKSNGPATSVPASDALNCQAFSNGNITIGNGPGDTGSGPGAILGFEHAFYTDRSAVKAQGFTMPGKLDVSQQVIDQYPAGTTYCLRISGLAPDTYNVTITEHHPDGSSPVYSELIYIQNVGGKSLISGIPQH